MGNEKSETSTASPLQKIVMCDCLKTMAGYYPESFGEHHHKECPKYKTEKIPYLFYFEDAINKWIPAPDRVEDFIDVTDILEADVVSIDFKCLKLTDKEFDALPED